MTALGMRMRQDIQFQVIGMLNHPYINKKAIFKRLIIKLKGCDE